MNRIVAILSIAIIASRWISICHGQNIDYLGLEDLFGEPVTAIASGKPLRVSEAPLNVEIISHDEISRSGALDVPQLLRRVAGTEVSRNFKGQTDVNIRGYNQPLSNRLLVLINGRQVYIDSLGFTMWQALPIQLNEIKQIEIVKGPNTSLLGYNAASGVINIVTFDPLAVDADNLELRVGTQQHQQVSAMVTFSPLEDMALRLSSGVVGMDGFDRDIYAVSVSEEEALERTNGNLSWAYKRSNMRFEAEAGLSDYVADTMFASGGNGIFDLKNTHGRLSATFDTTQFGLISTQLYQNKSEFLVDFRKFNSTLAPTAPIDNTLNVFQINTVKALGSKHDLRLGFEIRNNTLQGKAIGSGEGRFNSEIRAVNTMWDWRLSPNFELINALRYDDWETSRDGGIPLTDTKLNIQLEDYERTDSDLSYNTSLIYTINHQARARLSVGKGLHIPSLAELSRSFLPAPVIENYGNPNLETEENTTIELGFNYRFAQSNTQLSINLFRQILKNIIGQTVVPPGPTNPKADITFENLGESSAIGFESSIDAVRWDSLRWGINYAYLKLADRTENNAASPVLFESNAPKHKLNLYTGYSFGRWTIDGDLHYVHKIVYQASVINFAQPAVEEPLESYVSLNLNISYKTSEHTQLALQGYNLIDSHQQRPDFQVGPSVAGGEELQPAFVVTFRYQPTD